MRNDITCTVRAVFNTFSGSVNGSRVLSVGLMVFSGVERVSGRFSFQRARSSAVQVTVDPDAEHLRVTAIEPGKLVARFNAENPDLVHGRRQGTVQRATSGAGTK